MQWMCGFFPTLLNQNFFILGYKTFSLSFLLSLWVECKSQAHWLLTSSVNTPVNTFITVLGEKKSVSWEERSSVGVVSHHCLGIGFAGRRSWKPTLLAVNRASRSVINWGQEEKRETEDEMFGWDHHLNGCEFEQIPGDMKDREAWCAVVHGVAKSWTWLSN